MQSEIASLEISESLKSASVAARAATGNVLKIREAIRQAQSDLSRAEENHRVSTRNLSSVEAEKALEGGDHRDTVAVRRAFTGSRDALDFARARIVGLQPKLNEALTLHAEATESLKTEWRTHSIAAVEGIHERYLRKAQELIEEIDIGIAIAWAAQDNRLLYRLLRAGGALIGIVDEKEVQKLHGHWKTAWKQNPIALEVHQMLVTQKGDLFFGTAESDDELLPRIVA